MSKKIKLLLQLSILIILLLLAGYYFFTEFQNKNQSQQAQKTITLEEIFTFNPVRQDLNSEQIENYKKDFEAEKDIILQDKSVFNFSALNHIAMIKKIIGDFDGAEQAWQYVGLARPENSVSFFNLGQLYAEDKKDKIKAEQNFLIALKNSAGESGNEQYYRAIVDFYNYNYPEKKQEIEKILLLALDSEQYKNSQDLLALLATYYQNSGEQAKAKEYWQKVLKIDPTNKAVKNEIEKLK